jgi:methyl coenzyme M reductase alpha subunit
MPAGSISGLSVTACEETLQRIGQYAGVAELLRRARGRCEALDVIAVPFSALPHHGQGRRFSDPGTTMQSLHLVARCEDVFDGISLGSIQVGPGLG